jgi:hypothetical protein
VVRIAHRPSNDSTGTKCPYAGNRLFDLDAAGLSLADQATADNDVISSVNELKLFGTKFLPDLVHVGPPPSDSLHSNISRGVEHTSSSVDHDLGVGDAKCSISVARVPCSVEVPHDLHVLLRHRPRSIPRPRNECGPLRDKDALPQEDGVVCRCVGVAVGSAVVYMDVVDLFDHALAVLDQTWVDCVVSRSHTAGRAD